MCVENRFEGNRMPCLIAPQCSQCVYKLGFEEFTSANDWRPKRLDANLCFLSYVVINVRFEIYFALNSIVETPIRPSIRPSVNGKVNFICKWIFDSLTATHAVETTGKRINGCVINTSSVCSTINYR